MNKKFALGILVLIILVVAGFGIIKIFNSPTTTGSVIKTQGTAETGNHPIKDFTMKSFVELIDGKPKPQYSLKEITVNKGDLVRINITVTKGMHDFNLDEFNIHATTPLNQEISVEFVADKSGDFIYYCSMPGHRQNGHWGTLRVVG